MELLNYLLATSCFLWNQNPGIVAGNGSLGNTTTQLDGPWDFSIGSNFNLYVSDGYNNRIIRFSSGSLIGIPLTSGVGNGLSQVSNPSASFIDIYGNLYVSDMFNSRVMKYTNISLASASPPIIGQVVAGGSYGSNYNQIGISWGVAVDVNGNVFVSDYSNSRVMKWMPGSVTGILVAGNGTNGNSSSQLSCPLGIYIDQNSALYIADACNYRIQKWLSGSSTGTTIGLLSYPTDVSVDTYGTVYALSGGGLYRFYAGSTLGTLVVTNYLYGFGFKFDSLGNVYLADFGANVIRKYNLTNTGCGSRMLMTAAASSNGLPITNSGTAAKTTVEVVAARRLPPQCASYTVNIDPTRHIAASSGTICDQTIFSNTSSTWVRFESPAGTMIPTSAPAENHCHTQATGWMSTTYPLVAGLTLHATVCYNSGSNNCAYSNSILVTNCRGFYVFALIAPPRCNLRYCTI